MRKKAKCTDFAYPLHANDQHNMVSIDHWQLPLWLKQARSLIDQGENEKAAQLLSPESINTYLEQTSSQDKLFEVSTAAELLLRIGQVQRAEDLYKDILKSNPDNAAIHNALALLCRKTGRIGDAIEHLTSAMEILPDEPKIWANMASNYARFGQIPKAVELLRKTIEKIPHNNKVYSDLLLNMHYLSDIEPADIFEESKKWAKTNVPQSMAKTDHENDPDPDRRLRIGYISPDFRRHSVNFFFEPLLDTHDHLAFEIYGYANVRNPDAKTAQLKQKFDHYTDISGLDDKDVAQLIESDGIDILVDMAGHSANSRIYAMAYKPAPLQVTWLGYPDTTGMSQIDYRLTDSIADPVDSQKFYTEKLIYLPNGFLCFNPYESLPDIAPLPPNRNGRITFGSFNDSRKINPLIIELWSRILKAVPNSDLLLKFKSASDDGIRKIFLRQFKTLGINPERITLSGWLPSPAYLQLYNHIDIALDTYPYNGTTTTCQTLSMSVPVISLSGDHHMSRVGRSLLSRLGLEFFAASTPDEYVSKAVALAGKPESLASIRSSIRARMTASDLCNAGLFTNNIENAYRKIWHNWCQCQTKHLSEMV